MLNNAAARLKMKEEWDRLRRKGVWGEYDVREWDEVRAEYTKRNEIVHMGY